MGYKLFHIIRLLQPAPPDSDTYGYMIPEGIIPWNPRLAYPGLDTIRHTFPGAAFTDAMAVFGEAMHNQKLFPTKSNYHNVFLAVSFPDDGGYLPQAGVALYMSVSVIILFEKINIQHQDLHKAILFLILFKLAADHFRQIPSVV